MTNQPISREEVAREVLALEYDAAGFPRIGAAIRRGMDQQLGVGMCLRSMLAFADRLAPLPAPTRVPMEQITPDDPHSFVPVAHAPTDAEAAGERVRELEAALKDIRALKSQPIGDTGFSTGPAAILAQAQAIARAALKGLTHG